MTLRETAFFWVGHEREPLLRLGRCDRVRSRAQRVARRWSLSCSARRLFAAVGVASIGGVRSGLPTMTFTRAAFGLARQPPERRSSTWAALVAFEAINCIFGVYALLALMAELGWDDPGDAGKVMATLRDRSAASAAIAIYGHATMVYVQRFFAVALTLRARCSCSPTRSAASIGRPRRTSTCGAWETIGAHPGGRRCGRFRSDLVPVQRARLRPLPARARRSSRSIFWTVSLSSGSIALLLSVMGVLLASRGDMSDPIAGVDPFVPSWVFVLYILAAGRRLDRQQRGRVLLVGPVPPVGRPAAEALPGDRPGHRGVGRDGAVHPLRRRTSPRCCTTSWRCSWSGSAPSEQFGSATDSCGDGATSRPRSMTSARAARTGAGVDSTSTAGPPSWWAWASACLRSTPRSSHGTGQRPARRGRLHLDARPLGEPRWRTGRWPSAAG